MTETGPAQPTGDYQFDVHQRYRVLASILAACRQGANRLRVLDLGCGASKLTAAFVGDGYEIVRADVLVHDDPSIVRCEAGAPLPFRDAEFDVAIALDVLEHMPAADRPMFVAEAGRVARRACVLSFPCDTEAVREAERALDRIELATSGRSNPFLDEHRRFGLPDSAQVRQLLRAAGFAAIEAQPNCALPLWLAYGAIDMLLARRFGDAAEKADFNRALNTSHAASYSDSQHYREIVVGCRDPQLARAVREGFLRHHRDALAVVDSLHVVRALGQLHHFDAATLGVEALAIARNSPAIIEGLSDALRQKAQYIVGLEEQLDAVRAQVGHEFAAQHAALVQKDQHIHGLGELLEAHQRQLAALHYELHVSREILAQKDAYIAGLVEQVDAKDACIAMLQHAVAHPPRAARGERDR